mmetsp:Transcript_23260/g.38789  ORF Transcript_23260/g.38789 Transcript_23260/m.38789 type:complete len:213 (+) Transcript_23260:91-729(+)
MDFEQCFAILDARGKAGTADIAASSGGSAVNAAVSSPVVKNNIHYTGSSELSKDIPYRDKIISLSTLDILKLFNSLQAKRIQTYRFFDGELALIIEQNCPARYPVICSEVTRKFAELSNCINNIKEILLERDHTEVVRSCIDRVQQGEKEKLTLVAARHLDELQDTVVKDIGEMTGGKTTEQVKYLTQQIQTVEKSIADAMEEIQCCLCDFA